MRDDRFRFPATFSVLCFKTGVKGSYVQLNEKPKLAVRCYLNRLGYFTAIALWDCGGGGLPSIPGELCPSFLLASVAGFAPLAALFLGFRFLV